ncbi:inositol monophosphatase [Enterovibrio sp. ZSDZ35]|uniref:Inositol monophosphatase n=1 Tax=Enterovibrio qingdaonensis TaxID=2899818 RepID=A0ABT5QI78_9GAMM|nr:inositol monophosphatase [Enterovibrio sp. ZSDZ35]MDD1780687.1 inositol monophosphatase [Enterovibrio sp. ZSDZ35]
MLMKNGNQELVSILSMPVELCALYVENVIRDTAKTCILNRFMSKSEGALHVQHKEDLSVVTLADKEAETEITNKLLDRWPDIPVLSEELTLEEQQAVLNDHSDTMWVLDPLDGTSNFAAGIPYFCTSLALILNGQVVLGLVYDPCRDEAFFAAKGSGAFLNNEVIDEWQDKNALSQTMALIDFKRLSSPLAMAIAEAPPYRSQRSFGASALDWCWIAANRCQIYLHGSQKLWDYAAGSLILSEAGGVSSTFQGEAVLDCSLTPRSVMAGATPHYFEVWDEWLENKIPDTADT